MKEVLVIDMTLSNRFEQVKTAIIAVGYNSKHNFNSGRKLCKILNELEL